MAIGAVTGETIKSAVSKKIRNYFSVTSGTPPVTTYPNIYKEQTVEDFEKPCFFIWTIDVSQRRLLKNTYERDYQMNVRYHAQDDDSTKYKTLCAIGEGLLECLSSINVPITLDGVTEVELPVTGTQVDYKINDDILQFYTTYTIKVKQLETTIPLMETLELNQV